MKKLHNAYRQTVQSIAFYPALICVAFIGASFLLLGYDDSESGKQLKAGLKWLRLRDADTARAIVSAVVTGLLTVTVFSFTMVMVVLTQAASHLSNRVLDSLIRNRYQQVVLGFFVGTIVFGLLLLASIRDSDSGVTIPAISTYALIAFTITDMFLFIYFLHFVTQSVRYQTIIRRIAADTQKAMAASCRLNAPPATEEAPDGGIPVSARGPGIYQGIERGALLELCRNRKLSLS
ncbi:MAG TPA: DUF2254 family protein, partial [Chitinophagales bacterium]|nr:DUF2254 family protein [Chitinophagales bacterium]